MKGGARYLWAQRKQISRVQTREDPACSRSKQGNKRACQGGLGESAQYKIKEDTPEDGLGASELLDSSRHER